MYLFYVRIYISQMGEMNDNMYLIYIRIQFCKWGVKRMTIFLGLPSAICTRDL
jgi:hypothetical protein